MFGWLKRDPKKALEKKYKAKLAEAERILYEKGDRALHADLLFQAEEIGKQIDALDAEDEQAASPSE